jgi:sec-independent protein translocase protein TatB
MFDIGFSELLVIAVVALVVLGPERLPKAARFAGLWVRRARAQWDSVKQELERELAAEELKRSLRDAQQAVRDGGEAVKREFENARKAADEVAGTVSGAASPKPDATVRPERRDAIPEPKDRPSAPGLRAYAGDERDAADAAAGPDAADAGPQADLFSGPRDER